MHVPRFLLLVSAVCLACLAAEAPAQEADFERLTQERSPALVIIKYVLKIRSEMGDAENESEAVGVMIEPDGLVITSNSSFSGGPFMRAGRSAAPTDIKILIGDDTVGLDATLAARDSELDLAWIRIKDPGERKFAAIDFSKAATPKVGDRLYTIVRLGKYFDRATVVRDVRLGGVARKPRTLLIPNSSVGGLGLPVFDAAGAVVGLSVVQLPSAEEIEAASSMQSFSGGSGLILPAAEIVKATQRAKEATSEDTSTEKPEK